MNTNLAIQASEIAAIATPTDTTEPILMSMNELDYVGGGAGVDTIG